AGRVLGAGTLDLDDTDQADTSSGLPSRKDLLELVVHVRPDQVDRGAGGQVTGLGSVARSNSMHSLRTPRRSPSGRSSTPRSRT
ncbi:hypothetical protein, partial [Mariniluteicoccus flavus]